MFFEGDLQSGIALAIQQTKRVVCFVRDDGEESRNWEHEYLADAQVSELLVANAVALRLSAGSQEAGFLTSFCPINKVPTLVVINNGTLQEYIASGTTKEKLKRRLTAALGGDGGAAPAAEEEQQQQQGGRTAYVPPAATQLPVQPIPVAVPSISPPDTAPESTEDPPTEVRRQSIREGKKRVEPVKESEKPRDSSQTNQQEWKNQRRKREQDEKKERERILALIRHDNEERKAKEERRKVPHVPKDTDTPPKPYRKLQSENRIQVRLFDGTSIRSSFSPSQTIRGDVRPWIDGERTDGDTPYTLKHILTPLPNQTVSDAEEDQKLRDLELGPTASFVMVPVKTYTEAYAATSSLPVRGIYAGYNLVTDTIGAVTGVLGTVLGFGQGQPSQTTQSPSNDATPEVAGGGTLRRNNTTASRMTGSNVRTLHDHRSEQPQEFYNGNQLNFEPRKEQEKDE